MSPNWKFAAGMAVLPALASAAPTAQTQNSVVVDMSKRIVGGTPAADGAYPFLVSLSNNGKHFCGGALLNANTVLTAAHCTVFQSVVAARVRAGTNNWTKGGVDVGITKTIVNSNYSMANKNNDIALWFLDTPIPAGGKIAYATLPAAGSDPVAGTDIIGMGWGVTNSGNTTDPENLLQVTMPVVDRATCQAAYGDNFNGASVTDNMFCAETPGKATCQGDSGGPVVAPGSTVVSGIVSWADGCGDRGKPGVYVRVGQYIDWINRNIV